MVVLSDGGKPVTVIRALDDTDDVISRRQRSPSATAGVRVPADAKRNSANRYHTAVGAGLIVSNHRDDVLFCSVSSAYS